MQKLWDMQKYGNIKIVPLNTPKVHVEFNDEEMARSFRKELNDEIKQTKTMKMGKEVPLFWNTHKEEDEWI